MRVGTFNVRSIVNKTVGVMEHLGDVGCDICLVQETFLREADRAKIQEIKDYGWCIISDPRKHRSGGGIGILYKPDIKLQANEKVTKYKSFQVMETVLHSDAGSVRLVNIYRPPYTKKAKYTESVFLEEFESYLDDLTGKTGTSLFMGDFNIHVERPEDFYPKKFLKLLDDYNLIQRVPQVPTHEQGGTLDLVITTDDVAAKMSPINTTTSGTSSDHYLVWFDLDYKIQRGRQDKHKTVSYRDFKNLDTEAFKSDLVSSVLNQDSFSWPLNEAVSHYNTVLTELMDKHCPLVERKVKKNDTPWIDEELRNLRRKRRAAERAWRGGKGPRSCYIELRDCYTALEFEKRVHYNKKSLKASAHDTKTLFKKVNRLLGKTQPVLPSHDDPVSLAEDFKNFFADKVKNIRTSIIDQKPDDEPHKSPATDVWSDSSLDSFEKVSMDDIEEMVKGMSNKFCGLDPIPTFLLKDCINELSPLLCYIVNSSIEMSSFPVALKKAVIKPTLKKDDADSDCLKNYRPLSNLPVLSKLLEKAILTQLNRYLDENSLHCPVQSGYRPKHSCETLLVRMTDDILRDMEAGNVVALVLLDLSAAFDTIDHNILIQKLANDFGIRGNALKWFVDYLQNRSFCVKVNQGFSVFLSLLFGVPQGSLLGPILFILYIKYLQKIAAKFGLNIQLYADDSQLYISFHPMKPEETEELKKKIQECLAEIQNWMVENFMKLNESKTELLLIAKPLVLRNLNVDMTFEFGEVDVKPTDCKGDSWKSLGVKLDPSLNMERQLNSVKQKCMWTLSNLQKIGRYFDRETKLILVKQLVISKLDYCNALYVSLPMKCLKKLKSVLNCAIRFIYNINDRDEDLLPYYKRAHILPIEQRIQFKICLLSYKVVYGIAPQYLDELLEVDSQSALSKTRLKSMDTLRLKTTRPSKTRVGERRFTNCAPDLWNSLPLEIRSLQNVETFKQHLKTHFFKDLTKY